jgi:hypothetical protein
MSAYMCVSGECQFKGDRKTIESILEKWRLLDLLIGKSEETFTLEGEFALSKYGPNAPVIASYFEDCLQEIAEAVRIINGDFRCLPSYSGDDHDLVFLGGKFVEIPLELQPSLEALDDPLIRDYYGLDYCVVTGP